MKYDWCSYGSIADEIRNGPNPPAANGIFVAALPGDAGCAARQDRDILFSFCQYGMGNVWEWGEQAGGNCWRTTGDIRDNWQSMAANGFSLAGHEQFAGPGHWNDPDMLVVGKVGWGPSLHATHLTPNEQYTHITLWCLLCSPLLIGCDMTQTGRFHEESADQRRGSGRQPGSAGQAGLARVARGRYGGLGQGHGRRDQGGGTI